MIHCRLADSAFDPAAELSAFAAEASGCGAMASFSGIARPVSKQGEVVVEMLLESHPTLTLASMEEIADQANARFDIASLRIVHRHGSITPGEAIVFVAATSKHRRAALQAVDYMMDRLKTEAVFWKREDTMNGSEWIEPTTEDYNAQTRWDERD